LILCPNCQHQEVTGALFCSDCGTQLVFPESLSTQAIYRSQSDTILGATSRQANYPAPPQAEADALISLHLLESGKIVALTGRTEFTLGRVAEGQPILPDVDLSPYEAYAQGVSRLHAVIKIKADAIALMDLGSSNGSRVNGQKIPPNVDYAINHGDVLSLGKFKVQLLVKR
jgi:pSer/pThr/pTyr-binding forkhead associated (FHA) protein